MVITGIFAVGFTSKNGQMFISINQHRRFSAGRGGLNVARIYNIEPCDETQCKNLIDVAKEALRNEGITGRIKEAYIVAIVSEEGRVVGARARAELIMKDICPNCKKKFATALKLRNHIFTCKGREGERHG